MALLGDLDFRNDPRLKYMSPAVRSSWQPENNPLMASRTAEDYAIRKRRNQKEAVAIAEMRRAGVRFLAGTDTGNPFCFPGFSLHDELTLMNETRDIVAQARPESTRPRASQINRFLKQADPFRVRQVSEPSDAKSKARPRRVPEMANGVRGYQKVPSRPLQVP